MLELNHVVHVSTTKHKVQFWCQKHMLSRTTNLKHRFFLKKGHIYDNIDFGNVKALVHWIISLFYVLYILQYIDGGGVGSFYYGSAAVIHDEFTGWAGCQAIYQY
jgi:hypothetical protein